MGAIASSTRSGAGSHGTVDGWNPVSVTSTRQPALGAATVKRPDSSANTRPASAPRASSDRTNARGTPRPERSTTTPEMTASAALAEPAMEKTKTRDSGRQQAAASRQRRNDPEKLIGLLPAAHAPKKDAPGWPGFLTCGSTRAHCLPKLT